MRIYFICTLITCIFVQFCFPSIRIIENTSRRFSFEWSLDSLAVTQNPKTGSRISFSGENVDLGENAEPVIPGYSFYIGVPQSGEASVRFSALSVRTILLSQPLEKRTLDPGAAKRYPDLHFSNPWISDARYCRLWRLRCGRFVLRPFQYDPDAKSLRVLYKGECDVEFPPSGVGPRPAIAAQVQRMLKNLMLNWERAISWAQQPALAKRAAVSQFPLSAGKTSLRFKVGDGHSGFNEGTTNENGLIRIRGADIVAALGKNIAISQISLYASYRGEMPLKAPDSASFPDGMREVPVLRFDVNNNGLLDSSDYILAYVSGASDWVYDGQNGRYVFSLNRYDDYRRYWICQNTAAKGLSLEKTAPLPAVAGDVITSFRSHLLLKSPKRILDAGGEGGAGSTGAGSFSPDITESIASVL